jgi:hypothetical protein
MRYMIVVKATKMSESGAMPEEKMIASMATFHEELSRSGALIDASGLHPSSQGWKIRYAGDKRTVVDGPFAETKELIAGYTIIRARSRDEALAITKRFPNPVGEGMGAEIEVRRMFELEDFEQNEAVDRFKKLEEERSK